MKSIIALCLFVASFGNASPLPSAESTLRVSCHKYDRYIAFKCEEQKILNPGLIGGYCGRPSACLTSAEVYVPDSELWSFMNWDNLTNSPLIVECYEYDAFVGYKCWEQKQIFPGLIGGWCGRQPTCLVGPFAVVPENEVLEYLQWKNPSPKNE